MDGLSRPRAGYTVVNLPRDRPPPSCSAAFSGDRQPVGLNHGGYKQQVVVGPGP